MRDQLSSVEQCAIDTAGTELPRVQDLHTAGECVLILSTDFDAVRALLHDEPDAPRLRDPRTNRLYALVPVGRYERFKKIFECAPSGNGMGSPCEITNETGKYPRELVDWAQQEFDEAEFADGVREIRESGGVRLKDFIGELEEIASAKE